MCVYAPLDVFVKVVVIQAVQEQLVVLAVRLLEAVATDTDSATVAHDSDEGMLFGVKNIQH